MWLEVAQHSPWTCLGLERAGTSTCTSCNEGTMLFSNCDKILSGLAKLRSKSKLTNDVTVM